jgi:hypothetical protein
VLTPTEQRFTCSRSVVSRVVAGETLIVPVRGKVGDLASIYSFNTTGSLIWKLLQTSRTVAELVTAVAQEFNVEPGQTERDVRKFVDEMYQAGLVEAPNALLETEGPVGREGLAAAGAS